MTRPKWNLPLCTPCLVALLVVLGCGRESTPRQEQRPQETAAPPAPVAQAPAEQQKPAETKSAEQKPAETKPAETAQKEKKPARPASVTKIVVVPAGTGLRFCLQNEVSTEGDQPEGRPFAGSTQEAVMVDGIPAIPAGSTVRGRVSAAKKAPRVGGKAEMTLEVQELQTPDGQKFTLYAEPLRLEGKSTTKGDVEKVAGGTIGGAILGGVLGGKKGAVKGAAGGAVAGGVWAVATRGADIHLAPNSEVEFTLTRALRVTATVPVEAIP